MNPTPDTQHHPVALATLCQLPPEELRDYARRVAALCELLHGAPACAPLPKPQPNPQCTPPSAAGMIEAPSITARPPMRHPVPGSIRAAVYEVLERVAHPVQRSEVVDAVASLRGATVTTNFRSSVSEALRNKHDPRIRRVGRGTYAFVEGAA